MKVIITSNFNLKSGRGPVFRLLNILPYLSKHMDLQIISLQEPDEISYKVFRDCNIPFYIVRYENEGWFVKKSDLVAEKVKQIVIDNDADLCVLGWEFWDVAVSIKNKLKKTRCEFAVVFHSMPFVDALPFPKSYQQDVEQRISSETNPMIRKFLMERSNGAESHIRNWNIISINATVSFYLDNYFPGLNYFKAYPGYAIDVATVMEVVQLERTYDFVFMSKLETSKGIFDLLEIIQKIKQKRPSCSVCIIGDFLYEHEKKQAETLINQYGIKDNIFFAGWLSDSEKYKELKKGKVFLYPSLTGDTFSFCLMEALACGLQAVCYDTPFVRMTYGEAPVKQIKYRDIESFASAAIKALDDSNELVSKQAVEFVKKNYSDWVKVALAEEFAYEQIFSSSK